MGSIIWDLPFDFLDNIITRILLGNYRLHSLSDFYRLSFPNLRACHYK